MGGCNIYPFVQVKFSGTSGCGRSRRSPPTAQSPRKCLMVSENRNVCSRTLHTRDKSRMHIIQVVCDTSSSSSSSSSSPSSIYASSTSTIIFHKMVAAIPITSPKFPQHITGNVPTLPQVTASFGWRVEYP